MKHRLGFSLILVFSGLLLAAPLAAADLPPSSAVLARYVVLGSDPSGATLAWARVVTEPGYLCPELVVGRAAGVAMTSRDNSHGFPVVVCEAAQPFGQSAELSLGDGTLPLPAARLDPQHLVVFGDTGCKSSVCKPGAAAQPFGSLADSAAATAPEVVLHMGDYNYRGTGSKIYFTQPSTTGAFEQVQEWSYDAGDGTTADEACEQAAGAGFYSQNAANANQPDTWASWRDDFFLPASSLLEAAPWVVARGNHELCSRAGPGWFYFLDPSSNLAGGGGQQSCPEPNPTKSPIANVVLSTPYAVDLGTVRLIVLDSANACDAFTEPTFTAAYSKQLAAIGQLAGGNTWLMSHRPLWGVTGYETDKSTGCTSADALGCVSQTLQAALKNGLGGVFPAAVKLLLAGHMHRFQSLTFSDGRPPLVVVGTSGVSLDTYPPVGSFSTSVEGSSAAVLTTAAQLSTPAGVKSAFGYLNVTLGPNGSWLGFLEYPAEKLAWASCGSALAAAGGVCQLAAGIRPE